MNTARSVKVDDSGSGPVDSSEQEGVFEGRVRVLLGQIGAAVRSIAASHADLLALLAQFADLRPPAAGREVLFDEFAPEDVAAVLGLSPQAAASQMLFACTVARRLPHAVEALKAGVLDLQRLRSLENAVRPLNDPLVAQVEARVLAGGARPTRGAFTDACRRAVHRLDPAGAAERARARKKERRVWVSPGEDGTSCLSAVLPADEATACYQRVDQITQGIAAHRTAEDTRSRDQIRADVLVDLLCGRTEHAVPLPCEVQVVVPVTVLLGLAEDPGEIPGYGPIPAAVAWEMAARPGSTWRRILTDPQGTLVEIADRRFPTAAQARHVRARNRNCVFPGCARTSQRADIDHTVAHATGGPTLTRNLGPTCRKHHRMKHSGRWRLTQPEKGTFVWTGPFGATLVTHPHSYIEPQHNSGTTGEGGDEPSGMTVSGWKIPHATQPPF
ncbi:HNH endonuclease signature motif containing protein [Parafrankia sp. BMG5.11]|uniref:HNH endonuclease signature motif containing protein n=1 Tax=Parafrankia sp. BMG5.11 TaxID=222540 RepID=UPI00103FB27A|nr:HNH endonuclease signature motif containing protein [Parafrankia sp. BMG5.11]TCJ34264.1 HNH endonuclease [Parafrankia sp. BMG5.11]